ncbi:MAG: hypothetical protein ACI4ST_02470 [Candidatus Gallimonas sp.]
MNEETVKQKVQEAMILLAEAYQLLPDPKPQPYLRLVPTDEELSVLKKSPFREGGWKTNTTKYCAKIGITLHEKGDHENAERVSETHYN